MFTKAQYSARCSSSLCLKPYHESFTLGSSGRISIPMTLLSSLNLLCQEALDLERSNGVERTESKCRKDDHDLRYGPGPDLGEFPCAVCCTGVGSNSIFCNGCKHWVHKKCSGLKHLTKDPDYRCVYMVPGNCTPFGRQTTEGSLGQT